MGTTPKLGIPLIEGSDQFIRQKFNEALAHIDEVALPETHEESRGHWPMWEPNKEYMLIHVVRTESCPEWGYLECTQEGISGSIVPTGFYGEGDTVSDGAVIWTLRRIGGGVTDHNSLTGRNLPAQHPIDAIAGLGETLAAKADLDASGKIPITQLPANVKEMRVVANIAARNAIAGVDLYEGLRVRVLDATGDPTVAEGWAEYLYDATGSIWIKLSEKESLDVILSWNNIQGVPTVLAKLSEENGRLAYDGQQIVGGAQTWQADEAYQAGVLAVYNGLLYRCVNPHTSGEIFDEADWEKLTIGYIPVWSIGNAYHSGMVVTRGNSIYRCLTPHTSGDWDNVQRNYWEIIAGKGAALVDWQPNTDYSAGEAVIYSDILYYALADHHSSSSFSADMVAGIEKWKSISTAGATGALRQATYLGVVAPVIKDIIVPWTDTFLTPPVECLKFIPGTQDQVYTACAFDNADADDFTIDGQSGELSPWMVFDGVMRPKTTYALSFSEPASLSSGSESISDWVDILKYKSVAAISIG